MAGTAQLTGALCEQAQQVLIHVASVLSELEIDFALDCGTLLGAVRENRILPWDNDMDLCVLSTSLPKLKKAYWKLWRKGFRVRFAKAQKNFGPIKKGSPRILKIRTRKGWFHRGDILLDIFIKYPDDNGNTLLMVGDKTNSIVQSFKADYFHEKTTYEFLGYAFPIPKNYDAYLTDRYGDWRTPVKDWNYLTDDNSRLATV